MNNRDLFNLLQSVLDKTVQKKEAKEKAIQYSREHKIDKSIIMTVAGAANMKLDYNALAKKGDGDMCTLFEEIAKENKVYTPDPLKKRIPLEGTGAAFLRQGHCSPFFWKFRQTLIVKDK